MLAVGVCGAFVQAHQLQAEVLYGRGEFELALVAYHRAARLSPQVQMYRTGADKCITSIHKVCIRFHP